jgi:hypothetical protein
MNQRFLYMLVQASPRRGTYTLRRTNPSRLFYPKDSPEREAAAAAPGVARAATSKAAAMERPVEDARLDKDVAEHAPIYTPLSHHSFA